MAPNQISSQFNAEDAEIRFKSSDNVLFFIHRENLKVSAAGFPPVEFKTIKGETVPLTETSKVLELLFAFMYPNPVPDVKALPFEPLADLAEAAEKYQVFSAMMICNMQMRIVVNDNPVGVLRYAIIHQYKDMVDIAAPLAIGLPLSEALGRLPPNATLAWGKYYEHWQVGLVQIYSMSPYKCIERNCQEWNNLRIRAMQTLGGGVASLKNVESILFCSSSNARVCCQSAMEGWRSSALDTVNKRRPFSDFLFPKSS